MIKKLTKKIAFLNAFTGIILQLCNILSTFILPKIILSFFGSEVNGLISSIINFLLYISIVEASLSNVIMASLYRPLKEKKVKTISSIFYTSTLFYRKISIIFLIYSVLLSIIYPLIFKSSFSYVYVFSLILILFIGYFIQYSFSNTLKNFLKADKKVYIINLTQIILVLSNLIFAIISVYIYPSVHLLKFVSSILFVIQPIVFKHYINKHFTINKNCDLDKSLLKSRWNGLSLSIAGFIHNMTDIVLLTIFANFKIISIYSVYYLVIKGLEAIMTSISNGITPSLGNLYASDDYKKLDSQFNIYEFGYTVIIFFVFTITSLLITPFIKLYTANILDTNYYQPIFGYLIIISEALFLIKMPHLNLAYSANKFKDMEKNAYVEAFINIVISLLLVKKFGLVGVAIGTLIAMLYRTIFQIIFVKRIISFRTSLVFFSKLVSFLIISIIGFIICYYFVNITINSWISWIFGALTYSLIIGVMYLALLFAVYKKEIYSFLSYFKK